MAQTPSSTESVDNLFDRISIVSGQATSWLTLVMILVTTVVVIMRYVFDVGLIWLQESVTWMHAVVFMVGAAYTLQHEEHVRVDVFYRDMTARRRAFVDVAGVLFFLFPMCGFLAFESYDFVAASWSIHESSRESGGLPYPFVPLLKTVLLIMPVMLALQGISLLQKALRSLRGR